VRAILYVLSLEVCVGVPICKQATLVLREAIVVAAFYLVYRRVNAFCRWLYRFVTTALRQLSSPQGLHLWFHIHTAQLRIPRQDTSQGA
jgi:hypothetical protein